MPEEPAPHQGHIVIGDIRTIGSAAGAGEPTVKFVWYPGCQQLILWLPQPGHLGYDELVVSRDGEVVERAPVMSRLNGSVQMLWDTLDWAPGAYAIAISHDAGWRHEVELRKLEAGVVPPPEPVAPVAPVEELHGPVVYQDGFGNIVPDADLEMRAGVRQELVSRFGRRLEYEGNFRAGTIIYVDGDLRIPFYHEMCGGEMKFSIDLPAVECWQAETATPVSQRDEIVAFVAERVKREQAPSWRYEITGRSIDFY